MRTLSSMLVVVVVFVAVVAPARGQTSHAAPPSALDAAVQARVAAEAADRDAVLRLLARPEVRAIAGEAGIDLRRAEAAVPTLDESTVRDLAGQTRQVEGALAGGQSRVTISTTTIIIALLVIILLVVAIR